MLRMYCVGLIEFVVRLLAILDFYFLQGVAEGFGRLLFYSFILEHHVLTYIFSPKISSTVYYMNLLAHATPNYDEPLFIHYTHSRSIDHQSIIITYKASHFSPIATAYIIKHINVQHTMILA